MRVHYDNEVDVIYIKLGNQKPDGVVEISEGVNLDTTSENKIVGISNVRLRSCIYPSWTGRVI
jgi:uncharacterized protein YuzE